jgi:hypothetical protein
MSFGRSAIANCNRLYSAQAEANITRGIGIDRMVLAAASKKIVS